MPEWDLLLTDVSIATMCADGEPYGALHNAALAIADGNIAWVGPVAECPDVPCTEKRSLNGRWLTPALIDCHTHLVFAGNRATEFEARLNGATYEEIAAAGGGIMSTVRSSREASARTLVESSQQRLLSLRQEGVATIEIKSGYTIQARFFKNLEFFNKVSHNAPELSTVIYAGNLNQSRSKGQIRSWDNLPDWN